MEEIIEVPKSDGTVSKIYIGEVLGRMDELAGGRRTIIITDSNVHRRHHDIIDRYEHIIIGMGETNKTLSTIEKIYRELIELGADREILLVGFGGGIVTDITGFAASTYMRGVRFGFIASTLLAQVDASVGGKNGVNIDGYKNMAGCFNQPSFVLCDTTLLGTLPEKDFISGTAEVIKSGLIADERLFAIFEENDPGVIRNSPELITRAITSSIKIKAAIVSADERETGERKKLNLGHTFAHAIEKCSHSFLHGEAVGAGTVMISDLAVKMGLLSGTDYTRIKETVHKSGLPVETGIDMKRLLKALRSDKKRSSETIDLVLPTRIGHCIIRNTPFAELESYY